MVWRNSKATHVEAWISNIEWAKEGIISDKPYGYYLRSQIVNFKAPQQRGGVDETTLGGLFFSKFIRRIPLNSADQVIFGRKYWKVNLTHQNHITEMDVCMKQHLKHAHVKREINPI